MEYEGLYRKLYGNDFDGYKAFIPVCSQCSRYIKTDESCFVNDELKPNATCKKHGRVRMYDEGYI